MSQIVKISTQQGILNVRIVNEKKANALNFATSRILFSVFSEFAADPELRTCIISSTGKRHFCAGWEYRKRDDQSGTVANDPDRVYARRGFGGSDALLRRNKPVIAAVNGLAVGGGVELIMCSDIIIATSNAEFYLPEAERGFISEVCLLTLVRRIPYSVAMRMILTGYRLKADEALNYGLINEIVDDHEELLPRATEYAKTIASRAPLACESAIEIALKMGDLEPIKALEKLRDGHIPVYTRMIHSSDIDEGIEAFFQNRAPTWQRS